MRPTLLITFLAALASLLTACGSIQDLVSAPTATTVPTEIPATATPTSFPTATSLPTAIPQPTATLEIPTPTPGEVTTSRPGEPMDAAIDKLERIYGTTFDTGWPVLGDEQSKLYADRGLLIFELALNTRRYLATTVLNEPDIVAEVEATPSECPEGGGYGLIFRLEDDNNYYALTIFCDGRVTVYARKAGELIGPLLDASMPTETAPAKGSHLIRIGVLGNEFTAHINGQLLGSFENDLLDSGDLALYASTTTGGTLRVAFDNLGVWTAIGGE